MKMRQKHTLVGLSRLLACVGVLLHIMCAQRQFPGKYDTWHLHDFYKEVLLTISLVTKVKSLVSSVLPLPNVHSMADRLTSYRNILIPGPTDREVPLISHCKAPMC